jgi:uncharacterized RDD family membrane protein YckC
VRPRLDQAGQLARKASTSMLGGTIRSVLLVKYGVTSLVKAGNHNKKSETSMRDAASTFDKNLSMAKETPNQTSHRGGVLGRIVGSVVSPIVAGVDVDEVIDQIDINDVVARIDINDVVDRIDINQLADRVDMDHLIRRIDADELVASVDLDRVLGGVDIDRLIGRIDADQFLDRIDPDTLLDRIDPNRLLDRVDPDKLLDRVDPDKLLDRVDPDRLLDRVDVNELVARTEIGEIIARSTTGVFGQLLDVARTQIIITDQVAQGVPARLLRGAARELPLRPGDVEDRVDAAGLSPTERAVKVQGRFAGSVSRFLAFLVDQFIIGVLFTTGALVVQSAIRVIFQSSLDVEDGGILVVMAFALWSFLYTAGSLAATGRTIGKAILGLTVVRADGTALNARRAALRTLMFPLSFVLFGIGFLIGLVRRDRRELHDLIADTGVVYAWDAHTARLRAEAEEGREVTNP